MSLIISKLTFECIFETIPYIPEKHNNIKDI